MINDKNLSKNNMFDFRFLRQDEFEEYADSLFSILYDNMSQIAPTGNSREEDFLFWLDANKKELKKENRHVIILEEHMPIY